MSWYVHPSKQLRDDELPTELVVTNRDGSIEQAYVPYNASERLQAENARLRELVRVMAYCMQYERECDGCRLNGADGTITAPVGCDGLLDRMRELGVIE
jgi:hypothetical protein